MRDFDDEKQDSYLPRDLKLSRTKLKRTGAIFVIASVAMLGMILIIGVLSSRNANGSMKQARHSFDRQSLTSTSLSANQNVITLSSCSQLLNISDPAAYYVLATDLSCTLSAPLFEGIPFTGTFDGANFYLNLTINATGNAGLFDIFSGTFINLNIYGLIQGNNLAGAFAAQIHGGLIQSCGSYANVICLGSNAMAGAGGFFGYANSTTIIRFQGCVSQGFIQVSGSTVSNYASGYIGYFILSANIPNYIIFDTCLSVPISLAGNLSDPFANSFNNSFTCTTNFCTVNLNCINSYYNDKFTSSLCAATSATNDALTCPSFLISNGVTFFFTCTGGSTGNNAVYPVFPVLNTCTQSIKVCTFLCFNGGVCVNGKCMPAPFASTCPLCPEGSSCVNGVCVQSTPFIPILSSPIVMSEDCLGGCPDGSSCVSGQCVPSNSIIIPPLEPVQCDNDLGCPLGFSCSNGSCVVINETLLNVTCVGGCENGTVCYNGTCIPSNVSLTCVGGCPDGSQCVSGQCAPLIPIITPPIEFGPCQDDSECSSGFVCINSTCTSPDGCPGGCLPGSRCSNGKCIPFGNPVDCPVGCPENTQCLNGQCVPIEILQPINPVGACTELCKTGFHCVSGKCIRY